MCDVLFSSSSYWTTPITSTTLVTVAASSQPALLTGMPCDVCFIEC